MNIRENFEGLEKILFNQKIDNKDYLIHLFEIKQFLTKYLSITGFPEEKEKIKLNRSLILDVDDENVYDHGLERGKAIGYNQALQDCKLHILKKAEGIEEIVKWYQKNDKETGVSLIEAIQSKLLGGSDE